MADNANIVANAVGELISIEELSLYDRNDQCFIFPILAQLVDHAGLKHLTLLNNVGSGLDGYGWLCGLEPSEL